MSKKIDITGQKFGRLTAIRPTDRRSGSSTIWECECDCGKRHFASKNNMNKGNVSSCGCYRNERRIEAKTIHGKSYSRVHRTWCNMKKRCNNPNCEDYPDYGGRGIGVCDEWNDSFEAFYSDMGDPPDGKTIHRKDNNLGYGPENCVWADKFVQARHKSTTVNITFGNTTMCLEEWAREAGMNPMTLKRRLRMGWPVEAAILIPPGMAQSTSAVLNKFGGANPSSKERTAYQLHA